MISPSYYIEPTNFEAPLCSLVIQISNDNFLFTIKDDTNKFYGFWRFDININANKQIVFNQIIEEHQILRYSFYKTIFILKSKEQMFIPFELSTESNNKESLEYIFGEIFYNCTLISDNILNKSEVISCYSLPNWVKELNNNFVNLKIIHENNIQFSKTKKVPNYIQLNIEKNEISILLVQNGTTIVIKKVDFLNSDDIVFHLLNTCNSFDANTANTDIYVNGFIDKDSVLYRLMDKYFAEIVIEKYPTNVTLISSFKNYPEEFFSHFIELASCV